MAGKLDKNEIGQWRIVYSGDDRVGRMYCDLSSGDRVEVYSHLKQAWIEIMVVFDGRNYVAQSGDVLFIGQPARLKPPYRRRP